MPNSTANQNGPSQSLPIIDLAEYDPQQTSSHEGVAAKLRQACEQTGFFYLIGHRVDSELIERLEALSRQFFHQDRDTRMAISMQRGGRAWRGYFPVGDELTAGMPDQKEGLYFGSELGPDHPKVQAGVPLHGPNLFPNLPGFRDTVLEYLEQMTQLGHRVMQLIACSLDLPADYFADRYTSEPLILFRIFHYPPLPGDVELPQWSVGEHTDYGLLTILHQDDAGGLQVKSHSRWIEAPPIPRSFVCNIGDMLDRMTGGLYRSTPHRVRNTSRRGRLSFPFFFDPNFDAHIEPIDSARMTRDDREERWDQASVHAFQGTYGDYVLAKVSQVFPQLGQQEGLD